MGERQVTVDGTTRKLKRPFFVLATQNPVEYEGTFPLPEAQLDRFFMKLSLGYLDAAAESQMLLNLGREHPDRSIWRRSSTGAGCPHWRSRFGTCTLTIPFAITSCGLALATRAHADLCLGASPRGSLRFIRSAQAFAALQGRDFALPDDVKLLAPFVLSHRCLVQPESGLRGVTAKMLSTQVLTRHGARHRRPGLSAPCATCRSTSAFSSWRLPLSPRFHLLHHLSLPGDLCLEPLVPGICSAGCLVIREYMRITRFSVNMSRCAWDWKTSCRLPLPWVQFKDRFPLRLRADAIKPRSCAARQGQVSYEFRIWAARRGYYRIGPLQVTVGDLFGFREESRARPGRFSDRLSAHHPADAAGAALTPAIRHHSQPAAHFRGSRPPAGRSRISARRFAAADQLEGERPYQRPPGKTLDPAISLETMILLNLRRKILSGATAMMARSGVLCWQRRWRPT